MEPQLFGSSGACGHSDLGLFLQLALQEQTQCSYIISLPDGAASAQVAGEALKMFEHQKCGCWDVRESKVAGTDGVGEQSWSHRLALWSLSHGGDSTEGLRCGEGTSLQLGLL